LATPASWTRSGGRTRAETTATPIAAVVIQATMTLGAITARIAPMARLATMKAAEPAPRGTP
jgi:hypothetical protein